MHTQKKYHLLPGTILDGRYRIQGVLGEGGFGITYIGINERLDMRVAVKELYLKDHMHRDAHISSEISICEDSLAFVLHAKEKFLKEARILGDFIDEPNIVDVIDFFEDNQTAYLVMNYLDGITMKKYLLSQNRLESKAVFRAFYPLLEALEKVHSRGLIHRDISPDNIMMMPGNLLILMDFGAARDYSDGSSQSSLIVYKDSYTPVEQYNNNGNLGPWTDLYALSATIYECITGTAPADALTRLFNDELPEPSSLGIHTDRDLEKILMKGLQVAPEDRYQTAGEMLNDLKKLLKEETVPPQKRRRLPGIAAAAVLLCIASLGGYSYANQNIPAVKFRGSETETVLLTPDEQLSASSYSDTKEILQKRLELLFGSDGYILKDMDGGRLQLVTRLSDYQGKDVPLLLKSLVTRPFRAYLGKEGTYEILPEDVKSITTCHGSMEGISPSDYGLPTDEDYYFQKLVLTPAATQNVLDHLPEGSSMLFFTDVSMRGYSSLLTSLNVYYEESSGSFYLFGEMQDPGQLELFQYNLTHPKLPYAFYIYAQIPARWEDAKTSILAGQGQVNVDEITGDTLTIRYNSNIDSLSNGQWYNVIADIKTRLDALEIPYAFGTPVDSSHDFILRLPLHAAYSEILYSLGSTSASVNTLWGDAKVYLFASTFSDAVFTDRAAGSGPAYTVPLTSYDYEKITSAFSGVSDEQQTLYLLLGEIPILKMQTDLSSMNKDSLCFTQINDKENTALSEHHLRLLNYIDAYIRKTSLPESYEPVQICAADGQNHIITDFSLSDYSLCIPEDLSPLEEDIQAYFPGCSIEDYYAGSYAGRVLTIDLARDWNPSMADDFFTRLPDFYENSGYCDGTYNCIYIRHTTDDDSPDLLIYLSKGFHQPFMTVSGNMKGEKYQNCIQPFLEKVKTISFYQDPAIHTSWTIGDRQFDYQTDSWQDFLQEERITNE